MSNKVINNSPLKKLVKFYFSKYPTIDFSKITKMTNNFVKEINKYTSSNVPSWVGGRVKDIALNTVNFIKNNIHLLTLSKKFYTYQEYQQLLKLKPVLHNLDILAKEDKKVQSIVTHSYVKKKWNSSLYLFLFLTMVITTILVSLELYIFFAIYIFFSVSFVTYLLTVNEKYRQWFFSIKDNGV